MSACAAELKHKGIRIGLVPTMGCLHEGHLSLFQLLEGRCDLKAASSFVNPIQFGEGEDLERYPRDEKRDLELLRQVGCELVFIPSAEDMYPVGYETYIDVEELSKPLCGRFRPGHFRGVTTVVLRLFNLTGCSVAAFGLKDYQQAKIIEKMVRNLNLPVELVFGETVREADGLALSSRNRYLGEEECELARLIPKSLETAGRMAEAGETNCKRIIDEMRRILSSCPGLEVQYLESVDPQTLETCHTIGEGVQVMLAVLIGRTRLIDNMRISPQRD